ncbi:hypothetical protein Sme01_12070 [Sphaerisporangium melleum]|uniref:DUF4031 domain-containing protein n=1 Tax=Sphaerisporangium melleum TaxID=321316 RepID=A0A917RH95_9ACTN|nr:DUF4031 domain-containing protein [Sphaerisporangium melleum]GGL07071.1 hypothetical protein GCM10007964_56710 [Sphaerisporangium melleum]GII68731.1 hypothetical protein Sme01_12070 [Sphaerisporangium melleum]
MAVLIDPPAWPGPRGLLWSHLVSDVSLDELHAFAARLGVPPRAFDRDHYDVPETVYEQAVALGAEPVPARTLVRRLTDAGLRRRRRVVEGRALGRTGEVTDPGRRVP